MKLSDFGDTVRESVENLKVRICEECCKHYDESLAQHKDPNDAMDALIHEHCIDCPINFL